MAQSPEPQARAKPTTCHIPTIPMHAGMFGRHVDSDGSTKRGRDVNEVSMPIAADALTVGDGGDPVMQRLDQQWIGLPRSHVDVAAMSVMRPLVPNGLP